MTLFPLMIENRLVGNCGHHLTKWAINCINSPIHIYCTGHCAGCGPRPEKKFAPASGQLQSTVDKTECGHIHRTIQ